MQKIIQEWVEISEYDLDTAGAMLETGRYLYVAFMCQQAMEKILKAFYVYRKNELPPRTHNLLYIIDVLRIDIGGVDLTFLSQLNQFYIESRYPDERIELAKVMDKNKAHHILEKTREVWQCLRQRLQ